MEEEVVVVVEMEVNDKDDANFNALVSCVRAISTEEEVMVIERD